ncbi:MAG: signal peptidase I [Synechococcales bacterium]|nr:signal peptidase I [Synechococcales bacterium]
MPDAPLPPQRDRTPSPWKSLRENALTLIIALLVALLIRAYVAEPRFIPSDSMVPTLLKDDRLVVEKVSYYFRPPQFGEIVVFRPPASPYLKDYGSDQVFIKRVIGLPGQRLRIQDGSVYINDQPLREPYIAEPPRYDCDRQPCFIRPGETITVPEDDFFVMGDNRNNSNDSHVWGFLPRRNIVGRAWIRFFPLNRLGGL